MKELKSIEEFSYFISKEKPTIVRVFLDHTAGLSKRLRILNMPVVCIFLQSKELYRFIKVFSMDEVEEKLNQALGFI